MECTYLKYGANILETFIDAGFDESHYAVVRNHVIIKLVLH
jgi:hypothetical protein